VASALGRLCKKLITPDDENALSSGVIRIFVYDFCMLYVSDSTLIESIKSPPVAL
jgi:hypothetical protein